MNMICLDMEGVLAVLLNDFLPLLGSLVAVGAVRDE